VDVPDAFREHYSALIRYAVRFTGDPDTAEDVVQEAYVRLLEQEIPDEEVRPWLFVVTANLARDGVRRRRRRERLLETQSPVVARPEHPDRTAERSERVLAVRRALAELSERDRTLLLMREEGFRYREIAEAVGVKPTSVGALVARALRRFTAAYAARSEAHDAPD
jgi:RNA polymerase sigma-70 factor (ECF subfamily)